MSEQPFNDDDPMVAVMDAVEADSALAAESAAVESSPSGPVEAAPSSRDGEPDPATEAADDPDAGAEGAATGEALQRQVEAVLMSTDRPQRAAQLRELLGVAGAKPIQDAIKQLNRLYEQTGRSFRIERVADGWQIATLSEFEPVLSMMHKSRAVTRLGPAAMETLAIIAYEQPILRADVEAIRGVASGEMIRGLMERRLVKITGRAEELGRPMLYGTTKTFLEVFGLGSLKDLPKIEDFKSNATRPVG